MNHHRLLISFVLAVAATWPAVGHRIVAADFAVQQKPDRVLITDGGRPVATYVFRDDKILRPYFANVHAPGGIQVTRNHPPVPNVDATDHDTMHPGGWLAFGDVSGHDFWRNKARIVHVRFVEPPAVRDGQVTFTAENSFQAANGGEICKQTSRLTLAARPAGYLQRKQIMKEHPCVCFVGALILLIPVWGLSADAMGVKPVYRAPDEKMALEQAELAVGSHLRWEGQR